MSRLDFLVTRRGVDPAAETAAMALRDLMGADVAGLERGELWRFEVENGATLDATRTALERAACRAGRYVNLNRDTFVWLDEPRPYPRHGPTGGSAVDLWVTDGDGRDAAALAWFRAQASADVRGVRRGVLWRLVLPVAKEQAADIAWSLGESRARRDGLLFNPHAQRAEIVGVVADRAHAKEER
jgi:hypothetical protein